jgi:hypothetical protein
MTKYCDEQETMFLYENPTKVYMEVLKKIQKDWNDFQIACIKIRELLENFKPIVKIVSIKEVLFDKDSSTNTYVAVDSDGVEYYNKIQKDNKESDLVDFFQAKNSDIKLIKKTYLKIPLSVVSGLKKGATKSFLYDAIINENSNVTEEGLEALVLILLEKYNSVLIQDYRTILTLKTKVFPNEENNKQEVTYVYLEEEDYEGEDYN